MERCGIESKVVVVGGANIDIQGTPRGEYSPEDSNPGRVETAPGGVGRNIAENLRKLGFSVSLITAFGKDRDGEFLRADCAAKGIDTGGSLLSELPTARYLCLLNRDGTLIGAVADMDAAEDISPEFLETRMTILDQADIVVADANLPAASLAWIASRFGRSARKSSGLKKPRLYLDTVSAAKAVRVRGYFGEFDVAKPNEAEFSVLEGEKSLPTELFISMGIKGMRYQVAETDEAHRSISGAVKLPPPSLRPKALNRSGAGDAALAALIWAGAKDCSAPETAMYALTAALLAGASRYPVAETMNPDFLRAQACAMFPDAPSFRKEDLHESLS